MRVIYPRGIATKEGPPEMRTRGVDVARYRTTEAVVLRPVHDGGLGSALEIPFECLDAVLDEALETAGLPSISDRVEAEVARQLATREESE